MWGEILLSSVLYFSGPNYAKPNENKLILDQGKYSFEHGPLVAIREEELEMQVKGEGDFFYNPNSGFGKNSKGFVSPKYNRKTNSRNRYQKVGITSAINSLNKSNIVFENGNSLEGFIFDKKRKNSNR